MLPIETHLDRKRYVILIVNIRNLNCLLISDKANFKTVSTAKHKEGHKLMKGSVYQ